MYIETHRVIFNIFYSLGLEIKHLQKIFNSGEWNELRSAFSMYKARIECGNVTFLISLHYEIYNDRRWMKRLYLAMIKTILHYNGESRIAIYYDVRV